MTNHKNVIALPQPRPKKDLWRFFGIEYPNGTKPMDDWFRGLSSEAQFNLIDALKDAQKIENPIDWLCFKGRMRGELRKHGVLELRFSGDKRQHRVLGVTGPVRKQFIFLMGYYHKGGVYTPPDALKTALARVKDLEGNRVKIYERKIPTNR